MAELIDFLTKPLIEDGWEKLPTAFMKNGCLLNFKGSAQGITPSEFLLRSSDVETLKSAVDYNTKLHKLRVNYSTHVNLPNRTYTLEYGRCVIGTGKIATSITKLSAVREQNSVLDKFLTNIDELTKDIDKTYHERLIPYRSTFNTVAVPKRIPMDDSKTCEEWYYSTIGAKIPIMISYIDIPKNYEKCLLTIAFKDNKYLGMLERQRTGLNENYVEFTESDLQKLFVAHFLEPSSRLFYVITEETEKRTDNWEISNKKRNIATVPLPGRLSEYDVPLHIASLISSLASNDENYGPLLEKSYNDGAAQLVSSLVKLNEDYSIVPPAIEEASATTYKALAEEVNIKRFLNTSFNPTKINSMFEQFTANVKKQLENFPKQTDNDFKEIRRLASIGVGLKESIQIPDAMRKRAYYFFKTSDFPALYEPLVNRGEASADSIKCTKASYGELAFRAAKELCYTIPDAEFYGSTVKRTMQYVFDNLMNVTLNQNNELIFNAGVMGLLIQKGYFALLNSYGVKIASAVILDGELIYEKNKENMDLSFID